MSTSPHRCGALALPPPRQDGGPSAGRRTVRHALRAVRDSPNRLPALLRFMAMGGAANIVYAALFLSLAHAGPQTANAVGSIGSTVVATELHRRLTFRASSTVSAWTAQLRGGALTIAGTASTALALLILDAAWSHPTPGLQLLTIGAVSGAVGLLRFLILRAWFHRTEPTGR